MKKNNTKEKISKEVLEQDLPSPVVSLVDACEVIMKGACIAVDILRESAFYKDDQEGRE